jgi:hypothetical protein
MPIPSGKRIVIVTPFGVGATTGIRVSGEAGFTVGSIRWRHLTNLQ